MNKFLNFLKKKGFKSFWLGFLGGLLLFVKDFTPEPIPFLDGTLELISNTTGFSMPIISSYIFLISIFIFGSLATVFISNKFGFKNIVSNALYFSIGFICFQAAFYVLVIFVFSYHFGGPVFDVIEFIKSIFVN